MTQLRRGVGGALDERDALRLEEPADPCRLSESRRADRAVRPEDTMSALDPLSHEPLVERSRVAIGPAVGMAIALFWYESRQRRRSAGPDDSAPGDASKDDDRGLE